MNHLSKKWSLKSLTIGPQVYETNTQFWEEALKGLPPFPHVGDVTIVYNYPTAKAFNTDCWKYFDDILSRRDLFPALRSVRVQPCVGWLQFNDNSQKWWDVYNSFRGTRSRGLMVCKLFPFERDHRADSPYGT